ncbi:hypothetical protein F5Y15DRAFT_406054 [Xylariaceae sp. FL0016]|nr:hypothetical protein F5Y15DRAFT_406054 [Xylariaceae sp. FL0016]
MPPPGSTAQPEAQWPPRSPHEALLSTPSGRERLRRLADRSSPSPSPSKRRTPSRPTRTPQAEDADMELMIDGDEDEETLELKLAAIQAKLKLKKLQNAKAKREVSATRGNGLRPDSALTLEPGISSRAQSRAGEMNARSPDRSRSQAEIQVPASPVRRVQPSLEHTSPSRVRLGIDKGLKAQDVSLKRAPSLRKTLEAQNGGQSGYLRRAHTPALDSANRPDRPKSFSERMAAARNDEVGRQERQAKMRAARSNAFQLSKDDMDHLKNNATEIPELPSQEASYSREDIMVGDGLKRSNTMLSVRRQDQDMNRSASSLGTPEPTSGRHPDRKKIVPPSEVPEEDASAFEPYSSVHLSKRIIPHPVLTRNLGGKKSYVIKDVLKHVKAPDFELPDVEQDIVIFGILASKSDPRSHKETNTSLKEKRTADPGKGKYMVLKLVDLQWELDLFIFNSGFDRFWKLVPGTLLAILNPNIMPPPPGREDTGRFSLVINSDQDTILEIGTARDLGYCKSVKKDGETCGSWVNKKRTEFCEFHMNLALGKHRQARQDVNAFNTGLGPKDKKNGYRLNKWESHANDAGKGKRGNFDRDTQSALFMRKGSAATMMDNEVLGGEHGTAAGTIERKEALRRKFAAEEKERDIMKKLGKVGSGAGKDYMHLRAKCTTTSSTAGSSFHSQDGDERPHRDARSLGLVRDRGSAPKIHLSPVKRKRVDSGPSSLGSSSSAARPGAKPALGWGGGLKEKLSRMKEGEKLRSDGSLDRFATTRPDADASETAASSSSALSSSFAKFRDRDRDKAPADKPPARKKTRFVTEKGIREAGRESLGGELGAGKGMVELEEDDEDLLIID